MRIRTVDAFTDRPYTGNPAGVVLLPDGPCPSDDRLQLLAAEINLPETAFARPLSGAPDADWELRWFTPATEVDLCGHATLATTHVLRADGLADGAVRFRTRSGVLTARTAADGTITLDFPTSPLTRIDAPAGTEAALGTEVVQAYDTGPLGDLLVELRDEKAVSALSPDLAGVAKLPTYRAVIVTAQAASAESPYDYVSRMFAPGQGIPEDPVTGSAHTALAPLWSGRLGSDTLTGRQISARSGTVRTTLRGERTELTGTGVTVLDAQLQTEL